MVLQKIHNSHPTGKVLKLPEFPLDHIITLNLAMIQQLKQMHFAVLLVHSLL